MNFVEKIQQGLTLNPAAPAFVFQDRIMTAGQFLSFSVNVAKQLHEAGIQQGDTVGVSMDHSPLHCAVLIGLARLGAISMPLHPGSPPNVRAKLGKRFNVTKVIYAGGVSEAPEFQSIKLKDLSFKEGNDGFDFIDYWPDENTPARIALTSGTTGEPSGILYTHGYWIDRIAKTVDQIDASSRVIPVDLHLTLGNLFAFGALFAGGTVVFQRAYTLQDYIQAINLHAVTHVLMPPATAQAILNLLPTQGLAFPTLKHLRLVGATPSELLLKNAFRRLSPNIYLPYGISEVGAVSLASPDHLLKHPKRSGVLRPWVNVEVVSELGEVLPAGTAGEIRVRIEGMPQGYYLDQEKSALKFRDGWFCSGDVGKIHEDGSVEIEGRLDDRINIGGKKINPVDVESLLESHPAVREAAVSSIEHQNGSQVLVAAVVSDDVKITAQLSAYCRQKGLGDHAPRRFVVVKSLPRNEAGKIQRDLLPELFKVRK